MITLNKIDNYPNRTFAELFGLSTDEKPSERFDGYLIGNGSEFNEVDTGKKFIYDEESMSWTEEPQGSGGDPVVEELTVTENGTYTVEEGIDGFNPVIVDVPNPSTGDINITENGTYDVTEKASAIVNVPSEEPVIESIEITQNGTYSAPSGVDGYNPIMVSVGGVDDSIDKLIMRTISGSYTNNTVTKIGSYAFANCKSLATVSFPVCSYIGSSAFQGCTSLTSVSFPSCTNIGSYAFNDCPFLTTASFPVCTSISNSAFTYCYYLTTINFPECTTIGGNAFQNCKSLTTVDFSVCTSIGSYAFASCTSLTTVSFPACMSISSGAFKTCVHLFSLYLLGSSVPTLNTSVFLSTPISNYTASTGGVNGSIIVQESMLSAFQTATNWSVYSSRFSVWNGVD